MQFFLVNTDHFNVYRPSVPDIKYGEPLNVIISNHSTPDILTMTGFQNYYRSINFDDECMGWVGEYMPDGGFPSQERLKRLTRVLV